MTKPTASIGSRVHVESGRQVARSAPYQLCLFVQEPSSHFQIFSLKISVRNFVDLCNTPPVVSHLHDSKPAVTLPDHTQSRVYGNILRNGNKVNVCQAAS